MIAVKMSNGPVIGELHVDAEIGVAQQLDDALQCVAVATADAHQVALDGGLHLQFAVLDLAHDLARLLDGNALLQRDLLLHRGAGRRNERPISQPLQRHLALHQLAFQYLDDGLQLVLIRAGQEDLVVLLVQLDRGLGVLQIVTLLNLLHGLLDGVADLRQLDLGDYVETVIGHRVYRALSAISTFSVISSLIPDMEASRATVTAACTRSGSISATVGPWGGAFGAGGLPRPEGTPAAGARGAPPRGGTGRIRVPSRPSRSVASPLPAARTPGTAFARCRRPAHGALRLHRAGPLRRWPGSPGHACDAG